MVLNERPMKRPRRNRVAADLHDFLAFPPPLAEDRPFRLTVKDFLSTHARITFPPSLFPSLLTWQIVFRVGDRTEEGSDLSPVLVALDIVEEDVTTSTRSAYCNQCRVVGWSENPVCRKRYHFIIRAKSSGSQKSCTKCGSLLHLSESRCKWCDWLVTTDELEEWVYSQFEDNTHLLHGVVHSNGFGHLLLVNGKEGGSLNLAGTDIMNFWDRLCTALAVRKVSVMDVSRKYGVEYRLLNAITKGHSWYGNWGYQFGCGSYALTSDSYKNAAETLASVPLGPFLFMGRRPRSHLQAVIGLYCSLSVSELLTLKDLFSFLLCLIRENKSVPPIETAKCLEYSDRNILCAWTRSDVEKVELAMKKVLVAATSNNTTWVARHTLKGAVCKTAPPELLDYCIKHLKGQLAPNGMVVQSRWNSASSDIVFRLKPSSSLHHDGPNSNYPLKEQVACDLKFLFDSLLHPDTLLNYRPEVTRECVIESATKLLDCKQFMKDYRPDTKIVNNPSTIHLLCHVELSDQRKEDPIIPPEPLVLHGNATIADLKDEASMAFQEVYAMFKRFEVDELLEYGSLEDTITLRFLLGHSGSVKVKGSCLSKNVLSHFRRERGTENWTVDCTCGAKDDDGERMLACDNCGVWQHTRCVGIDNSDAIPAKFVCLRCMKSYSKDSSEKKPNFKEASNKVPISKTSSCRDEAGTDNVGVGAGLTMTFSVG